MNELLTGWLASLRSASHIRNAWKPAQETRTVDRGKRSEPNRPDRRLFCLAACSGRFFSHFCAFVLPPIPPSSAGTSATNSFQQMVRRRVITSAEKITGGRVELGELHTIPFRLRVDARNLTIHGREARRARLPFLHVDRVQAEMKILSAP